MATTPKILAFAGSTRRGSWNKKLVGVAINGAKSGGAEVKLVDLADYPMPLYDGDLESEKGIPDNARAFKQLLREYDGFLLACPEYNSSISGVLKNTIDWASRQEKDEKPLECFRGKIVSLMSASPGALGGLRGLVHVRAILGNIGCLVLPTQVAVPMAQEAFDADGFLKDDGRRKQVESLGSELARVISKFAQK